MYKHCLKLNNIYKLLCRKNQQTQLQIGPKPQYKDI